MDLNSSSNKTEHQKDIVLDKPNNPSREGRTENTRRFLAISPLESPPDMGDVVLDYDCCHSSV